MERDGARCLREDRAPWTGSRAPPGPVCVDQRASADQATMPAKSPGFKLCHRTLDQLLSHPIISTDGAPGQVGTKLSVKALINKDQ